MMVAVMTGTMRLRRMTTCTTSPTREGQLLTMLLPKNP